MRRILGAVAVVALLVTGCSSEPDFDEAAATTEVTQNWERWFDVTVELDSKLDLLEFGPELREISEQAQSNPTAAELNVEVSEVEFNSANDQAEVIYDLRNGDQVLLPGVNGLAVLVDGTWKVSALSYCELLALGGAICPGEVVDRSAADFTKQE